MRALRFPVSPKPAISVGAHFSVQTEVKTCVEDVSGASNDDDVLTKEVIVYFSDLQTCRREKTQLTIFQLENLHTSLRVVAQNHGYSLLKSSRADKYKCCAGMTTMASPASEKLGAANINSMHEHCKKKPLF